MKNNKFLIVLIAILSMITIVLIILLGITILNKNKNSYDKEESVDNIINEKILSFLEPATSKSGEPYYNILECVDRDDEEIFALVINYLYGNNLYTKTEDGYIFKQSDIIKYARTYMLKDNFDFITRSSNYKYDSKNKTFTSPIYVEGEKTTLIKSIEIYEKTETNVSARYEIQASYETSDTIINSKYDILIDISNDEYKIISITKIK